MRNKFFKTRTHSDQKPVFAIHQDDQHNLSAATIAPLESSPAATPVATPTKSPPSKSPRPLHERPSPRSSLSPASEGTINAAMSRTASTITNGKTVPPSSPASLSPRIPNRMNSTIRTVPSFENRNRYSGEDSSTDGTQSNSTSRDSGFSSSLTSNASMSSSFNGIPKIPSIGRLRSNAPAIAQDGADGHLDAAPTLRTIKSRSSFYELSPRDSSPNPTASASATTASGSATTSSAPTTEPPPGGGASNDASSSANDGWDNSVGKAGLGKTGRVINKLVSDNEALRRDIQIERLRAEESRQAARLLEDKIERVISEYETRLLEATVTKTLLARKERQVETLQEAVDLERKRAVDAAGRESVWKDELEKARAEAKRQVEEATNYAALCEGRYNAISGHWKDQGEEVRRKMGKMKIEVQELAEERKKDDGKIETLRELCDQQDGNIRELRKEKEDIQVQFERYKAEQEEALRDIKRKADEREREQQRTLDEAKEVLDKLKWALNVKGSIEWAQ